VCSTEAQAHSRQNLGRGQRHPGTAGFPTTGSVRYGHGAQVSLQQVQAPLLLAHETLVCLSIKVLQGSTVSTGDLAA
jgi:hypothetical protein